MIALVIAVACFAGAGAIIGGMIGHARGYRLGLLRGRIDEQLERKVADEFDRQVLGDVTS